MGFLLLFLFPISHFHYPLLFYSFLLVFSEITNVELETHKITNANGKEIADIRRTQYFIKTKDPQMPVWYFKFVVKGRVSEDLYIDRLTELYEKWHQIIVITLNHAVK